MVRYGGTPRRASLMNAHLTNAGREALQEQYAAHEAAYERIDARIRAVKGAYTAADEDTRLTALKRAYAYAVLTANSPLAAADRSYGRWLAGDGPREVCYDERHTNQKGDWFASGLENFTEKARPVDRKILAEEYGEAAEIAAENLTGISRVKARFMVGLLTGETACIDTHAERFVRSHVTGGDKLADAKNAASPEKYETATAALSAGIPAVSRFVAQWVSFDAARDTFTPHDNFYNSLPFTVA